MSEQPLLGKVAGRLRAVKAAFGLSSNDAFAEAWGSTKSVINNWLTGRNFPRVPEMIRLCERTDVTLDWLYRGADKKMDPALVTKLNSVIAEAKTPEDGAP
jgi:transcriptional regulator with XRE-family HTH domain